MTNIWRGRIMLDRATVEAAIRACAEEGDLEAFRALHPPDFVFKTTTGQPASGEWRGIDAMRRHFAALKRNFTAEFRFTATDIRGGR
jgi:ketosteroid isomerase-like protein